MRRNKRLFFATGIFVALFSAVGIAQDFGKANLLLLRGDYQAALEELSTITEEFPENPEAHFQKSIAYSALLQYKNAQSSLLKATKLSPGNTRYELALGKVYIKNGQDNEAKGLYRQILEREPENLTANIQLAELLYKNKFYGNALKRFRKLIALTTDNAFIYKKAGLCALHIDSTEMALNFLLTANYKNHEDGETYIHIANIYIKQEEREAALQIILNGLEYSSESVPLWQARGDVHYGGSEYDAASEAYLKVLSLGDSSEAVMRKLGISLYHLNDYPGALLALSKAQEQNNEQPSTYFYLGLTYKQLNQIGIALLMLQRASALAVPDYVTEIDFQLAVLYEKLERFPEAIKAYKRVLDREPERTLVLFYIASVYDRYYADRTVPLDYYQRFVEEHNSEDDQHIEYAKQRIDAIIEELHFNKKD